MRPVMLGALALGLALPAAQAATIVIVNTDGPGEGFNDTTPVLPVSGNTGTTLGQQRLNVFQAAAQQWAAVLDSDIDIRVNAAFNPLTCSGTSAVLGSAGATQVFRNFANAPVTNTWFSPAEANALSGIDNNAASNDINAQFNTSIDSNPACLTGTTSWWYGIQPSEDIPADEIPLMPVVFHELAHGLGFQNYTSSSTGAFNGGVASIWDSFLTDANLGGGTAWLGMTNAQRAASAIDDPNLVWSGANVNARARGYLTPSAALVAHAPASLAGSYDVQAAAFGPPPPLSGLRGLVVEALDGTAPAFNACEPIVNTAAVAGRIALVDRGTCNFSVKVANAQAAGAIGVLVANNTTGLPGMGGEDPAVTIPSYGITQAVGNAIRAALATQDVDVTLGYDFARLAGMTAGMTRMHGPSPLEPGSSVSHFSSATSPNLLMEPTLNETLFSETDLTVPLFRDIHWPILDAAIANVAPTLTVAPEFEAAEGVPTPLTEIVFGDADAGDSPLTVGFAVDDGTITLAAAAGVTLAGSGTADASITGARAVLLPYVVGGNVRFVSPVGDLADVGLLVSVDDNGNSGSGGALTADATATIRIAGDTPPVFAGPIADITTSEGHGVVFDVFSYFSDAEGDLSFSTTSALPPGFVLGSDGVITGTHGYDDAGIYPGIVVRASDGVSSVDSNAFTWTVLDTNRAPQADAQAVDAEQDTPVAITLAASDADGDTLTFTIATPPSHGTLSGSGAVRTYTPDAGFFGDDSFTFTVNDGSVDSAPATVAIAVAEATNAAPVFVAAPYAFHVLAGAPDATPVGSVAATDADGDDLVFAITAGDADGVFAIDADSGAIRVASAAGLGAEGTAYALTVRVDDGQGGSAEAVVAIVVRGLDVFADGFED